MIEFEKTRVEAKIYGIEYKLRRPTVKEAQSYSSKAKDIKDDEKAALALMDLLSDLGLPKKVAFDMESDHLLELVEAIMPSKKK